MAEPGPRFGWYGDDFTGATDTLATVARAGLRTLLFLDVPRPAQLDRAGPLDAIGIAGAARTMDPQEAARALKPVGRFFADAGVPVLHYKCCSTFDSAPTVGSIGAAVAALRPFCPNPFVPIVGGQPNIGRFCAFSTLFAAAGAGGAVHRIDRHPTMSVHPVTPMREADLRRHLGAQGLAPVLGLHAPAFRHDPEAALDALLAAHPAAILLDLIDPADLPAVGGLIWRRAQRSRLLAVGPSSVAQALAAYWASCELDVPSPPAAPASLRPAEGPVFLLAGSLSPVTRAQVEAATLFERVAIDADRLAREGSYGVALAADLVARLGRGRHVLAHTVVGDGPVDTSRAPAVAAATASLLAAVMAGARLRRVGVAGGDTSSLAAGALGIWGLGYRTTLSPGVTVCTTHGDAPAVDGVELMLKGGQMGGRDLFDRFVQGRPE